MVMGDVILKLGRNIDSVMYFGFTKLKKSKVEVIRLQFVIGVTFPEKGHKN